MRVLGACVLLACLSGACDRPPSDDEIREWTPADHDRAEESQRVASGQQSAGVSDAGKDDNRTLVELTWRQQCAQCHGAVGRGDGPNGPMVKASDLTRAEWQKSVTDEQIAQVITAGKGRMPKFDVPPAVLAGLVQRIRASRGQ
jgi:mono/diheme cytochrome c family protein